MADSRPNWLVVRVVYSISFHTRFLENLAILRVNIMTYRFLNTCIFDMSVAFVLSAESFRNLVEILKLRLQTQRAWILTVKVSVGNRAPDNLAQIRFILLRSNWRIYLRQSRVVLLKLTCIFGFT